MAVTSGQCYDDYKKHCGSFTGYLPLQMAFYFLFFPSDFVRGFIFFL